MNVTIPTFRLSYVPLGGFEGEQLKTKPLTLNEATAAVATATDMPFSCCYPGCTVSGLSYKMKTLDRERVPGHALAPMCDDHVKEIKHKYGVEPSGLSNVIRLVVEEFTREQRLATVGRFLFDPKASTPEATRPTTNGSNGQTAGLQLVGANGR